MPLDEKQTLPNKPIYEGPPLAKFTLKYVYDLLNFNFHILGKPKNILNRQLLTFELPLEIFISLSNLRDKHFARGYPNGKKCSHLQMDIFCHFKFCHDRKNHFIMHFQFQHFRKTVLY